MSDAISAHGSILAWQSTPGGSFSDIAEIGGDIVPPELTRKPIEVTTHNDDIDAFVLGVARRGEATLPLNFLRSNAGHSAAAGLLNAFKTNLKTGFRITSPDGFAIIFSGGVAKFGMKMPVDGALTADVAFRPTGKTYVDGVLFG